jgi:hypothetical protein
MKFIKKSIIFTIILTSLILLGCYNFSKNDKNFKKIETSILTATDSSKSLNFSLLIEGPDISGEDVLNILKLEAIYNDTGEKITENDATIHKYYIKNNAGVVLISGNLTWDNTAGYWKKLGISLSSTGSGKFFVTVEFKTSLLTESVESEMIDDVTHSYTRSSILDFLFILIIIIAISAGSTVIIGLIYYRKSRTSIRRKRKEKEKEVKILEIKKDELMAIETEKSEDKIKREEKGKTKASEDLIFSVPKWDEGDLEGDSDED